MILKSVVLFCALLGLANSCNVKRISSKLICYYSDLKNVDNCYCTHVVLPANTDIKEIDNLRKKINGVKILLTVHEFNQGLVKAVKQNTIDGLELNLKKLSSKEDVTDFISTVRSKLGNDLFIALSIPPKTELLAKYYDLKALTKTTDLFILQTSFLGVSKNVTFHPSRLSGMWDMQNTDSVVDLVTGLGAPLSRLVITAPIQAFHFRLQDSSLTTPGSPAVEIKTITRKDLCDRMNNGESWILERDQDQAGPYIFRGPDWIAFEDTTSLDIKAKYTRVRGMAGLALKDVSQDHSTPDSGDECGSLLQAAHAGLSKQNRVPRGAVLRSLEREILETPAAHLQRVEVSPYRITRIVDTEGHVHSVRKDTRTEFTCSRQGYFVHPSSCGRFYRCVKFDQLSNDFNVFEFDCPAGLAFDERVEVCVWPGSLPHGGPCQGSSEIAPVPRQRFKCPQHAGYYVDPENCRWFFACLDHGQSDLVAYEFRCPFGLVFDEQNLLCQWPWLVPSCSISGTGLELDSIEFYGGGTTHVSGVATGQIGLIGGQLDSYDGLGSLGVVALGGYQGDINLLKNSLQNHGGLAQNNLQLLGQNLGVNTDQSGQNIGIYHTNTQDNSNIGLSGISSGLNLGVNLADSRQNIPSGIDIRLGQITSGNAASSYSDIENSGANLALNSRQNIQSGIGLGLGQISTSGNAATSYSNIENSGINVGLNLQGASLDNSQDNLAVLNVQEGLSSGQKVLGTSGLSGLSSTEINLGLLDNSRSAGNIGVSIQDSGLSGNLAANDQAILVSTARPVEQAVLIGSNIKSNLQNEQVLLNNVQTSSNILLSNKQLNGEKASSYQSIQHVPTKLSAVEVPVQSVQLNGQRHSGTLDYNYQYANEAQYVEQPLISQANLAVPVSHSTTLQQIGTAVQRPIQYAQNYIGVTPRTDILVKQYRTRVQPVVQPVVQSVQPVVLKENARSHSYSSIHQYQTPVVQKVQSVQPIVQVQQHVQPVVQVQQAVQPIVHQTVQPVVHETVLQQPVLYGQKVQQIQPVVLQAERAKSNSYSSVQHYTTPVQNIQTIVEQPVVQVQKVQQPVLQQHIVQQPILQQHVVQQPVVLQNERAKSNSYSSVQHYQTPVVQLEQKVQPIVQETVVQQPLVQETIVQQPVVYGQKVLQTENQRSNSYSSIHHYQSPVVQLEQKVVQPIVQQELVQQPVVYEQRVQPVVQKVQSVQPVILQNERAHSNSYSSVQHYTTPVVQKVQPIVLQEVAQQPIVYEQRIQPVVQKVQSVQPVLLQNERAHSNSYSTLQHYTTPVVQKVQPIVQQEVVQQPLVYEQRVQPVVQKVQSVQPVILQNERAQSNSYSTLQHYTTPVVQKVQPIVQQEVVQQPIVYEQRVQPVVQKVQPVQPVLLQNERAHSNSYSTVQHYTTPVVQKVQPIVQQEVVQQPLVYEQRVQPVVQKVQSVQPVILQNERAHSNSYSTVQHYTTPVVQKVQPIVQQEVVQQPLIYEQRVQPVVQKVQPVVVQTERPQLNSYSSVQHYATPVQKVQPIVQQEIVQQPIVYEQRVQPVVQKIQPSIQHYTTPQPIVQQQIVQQPIVYEQRVQPVVQKIQPVVVQTERPRINSYSSIQNYATPVVQKVEPIVQQEIVQQPVVYEQRVQPVVQKVQPVVVQTERPRINAYSSIHYATPVVQKVQPIVQQEIVQQPVVYEQRVQPVVQKIQPSIQHYTSPQPIVQQEIVQQPIVYEQRVQPVVQKVRTEGLRAQTHSSTYQYQSPVVLQEKIQPIVQRPVVLEKKIQPVQPIQPVVYEQRVEQPVVQQEVPLGTYRYYDSRYDTSAQNQYLKEVVPVTPSPQIVVSPVPKVQPIVFEQRVQPVVQKAHTYQSYYQNNVVQPGTPVIPVARRPTVTPRYQSYVTPTVQPITYEARVPVVEPKIVQKIVQPLYVSTTSRPVSTYYVSTPRPKPVVYASTTPKYAVFQEYVQPKQTFEIQKIVQPTVVESYNYVPSKIVQENRQYLPPISTSRTYLPARISSTTPKIAVLQPVQKVQPTVISEYQYENPEFANYESNLNFNSVQDLSYENVYLSTERPISPVKAVPIKSYQTDLILSTPRPTLVSTIAPIVKQTPVLKTKVVAVNKFQTFDDQYLVSTPKPIYVSTPVVSTEIPLGTFRYYDSRYDTSAENQFLKEVPVTSTIRPVQRKKIISTTTEIPFNIYDYDQFDSQYISSTRPTIATTYRPRNRYTTVQSTTPYDDIQYVVTTQRPRITTRPVVQRKKITTTFIPEYEDISTARPVKITPRPQTVVRVNDFHPFLTTKLGAQCVCTSNTLKIKSRPQDELPDNVPVRKITSNGRYSEDLEEPGVYVVGSTDYDEYEPRKVVSVTKSPIRTTTNAIVPAPTPIYTIRRKTTTRPIESSTVSQIVDEVFIRKSSKEEKIAEAVNEGLKAIKGIVKEAVREEVRNFDRYGPGGWRSRDETLQGSVDCQRAGLFRHPTQCNKFYACHWDCTKQRYTLHVFNCPVHLTFDTTQGACNWPSKGPACTDNTLLPSS